MEPGGCPCGLRQSKNNIPDIEPRHMSMAGPQSPRIDPAADADLGLQCFDGCCGSCITLITAGDSAILFRPPVDTVLLLVDVQGCHFEGTGI